MGMSASKGLSASGGLIQIQNPYEKKCSTYYLRNKCAKYNSDNKTIKRLMSDESVSTNTLNSICNILDCDIKEIMEFQPDKDTDIDTNIDTDSNT